MLSKFMSRKFIAFAVLVTAAFVKASMLPKLDLEFLVQAAVGYAALNIYAKTKTPPAV